MSEYLNAEAGLKENISQLEESLKEKDFAIGRKPQIGRKPARRCFAITRKFAGKHFKI